MEIIKTVISLECSIQYCVVYSVVSSQINISKYIMYQPLAIKKCSGLDIKCSTTRYNFPTSAMELCKGHSHRSCCKSKRL